VKTVGEGPKLFDGCEEVNQDHRRDLKIEFAEHHYGELVYSLIWGIIENFD
jgi:hypothetical protein